MGKTSHHVAFSLCHLVSLTWYLGGSVSQSPSQSGGVASHPGCLSWAHHLDAVPSLALHSENQLPAGAPGQGELGSLGQTLGVTELLR